MSPAMNRDDAIRAFGDLSHEFPGMVVRSPPDPNDEEGYVVELRTGVVGELVAHPVAPDLLQQISQLGQLRHGTHPGAHPGRREQRIRSDVLGQVRPS